MSHLEQRVADLTPEKLSQNETFVTMALQATQIALRNHHEEKLSALRGAVFHSALPNGPEEQLQLMFLRFVDELTPTHLAMLSLFNGPVQWMQQHQVQYPCWSLGGVSTVVEHCFSALRGKREVYEQVVRDLQTRGLIHLGQFLNITMTGNGMLESRTTDIGRTHVDVREAEQTGLIKAQVLGPPSDTGFAPQNAGPHNLREFCRDAEGTSTAVTVFGTRGGGPIACRMRRALANNGSRRHELRTSAQG